MEMTTTETNNKEMKEALDRLKLPTQGEREYRLQLVAHSIGREHFPIPEEAKNEI